MLEILKITIKFHFCYYFALCVIVAVTKRVLPPRYSLVYLLQIYNADDERCAGVRITESVRVGGLLTTQ